MLTLSQETSFTINTTVTYTLIDEEAILMGKDSHQLYAMNPVATEIWQLLLHTPHTIPMIKTHLMHKFDVEESVCLKDTEALLLQLLDKQFILPLSST